MKLNELFGNNFAGSMIYSFPAIVSKRKREIGVEENVPVYIQWEELERIAGEKINDLNTLCSKHFHIDPNNPTPKDVEKLEIVLDSIQTLIETIHETFHIEDEENNPTDVVDDSQTLASTTPFRPMDVLNMKIGR